MFHYLQKITSGFTRMFGYELVKVKPRHHSKDRSLTLDQVIIEDTLKNSTGPITLLEAQFLSKLVANLNTPGPIVEVGTLFGFSTAFMLVNKDNDRKLISVDNYGWNPFELTNEQHYRITSHFLRQGKESLNLEQHHIDKDQFYNQYQGPAPSLVFLDAIHTYEATRDDILWAKKVNAEVICGHDYNKDLHPGVVKAVDEFGGPRQIVESLWVL